MSKKKIEFNDLTGKMQIKEICLLLLAKSKVVDFGGKCVRIEGKTFEAKQHSFAKQILAGLRKGRRKEIAKEIVSGLEPKKVSMLELVNTLFLGM